VRARGRSPLRTADGNRRLDRYNVDPLSPCGTFARLPDLYIRFWFCNPRSVTRLTPPFRCIVLATGRVNHKIPRAPLRAGSYRSGSGEVWLADADGGNERQLTNLRAHIAGFPRWSADGKLIAFHARIPALSQVYLLDVARGIPRQVPNDSSESVRRSWSGDGQSLFISKMTTGEWSVFKISAGRGVERRLFDGEGSFPINRAGPQTPSVFQNQKTRDLCAHFRSGFG